jgi:hypothetical protein
MPKYCPKEAWPKSGMQDFARRRKQLTEAVPKGLFALENVGQIYRVKLSGALKERMSRFPLGR